MSYFDSWPSGLPRHLTLPATSLWFNLEVSATRYPDKACVIFYDAVLTFADVRREAEQLAGFLRAACGVRRGDRVGLYMQNSPQFVVGFHAILRADAMVVLINPMNLTAEVEHIMRDSGATVLLAAQDLFPRIEPLLGRVVEDVVVACYSDGIGAPADTDVPDFVAAPRQALSAPGVTLWRDAVGAGHAPGPHLAGPDDRCVMPYTSGTTGQPKGCVHTHRSVMATAAGLALWHRAHPEDCGLAVLPFFHVTGLQNSLTSLIFSGATMVILPRWNRDVAARWIQRHRVTLVTAVPAMVVDLLSSPDLDRWDLSSIRILGGGGAAMPEAIAQKLQDLCGITYIEGYGLSETMAPSHINPEQRPKKQCLGIPIFDVESRVVDPETLADVPPGKVGEIVTRGPQVFQGYWNNPEADAACFVDIDGKTFFRTGDLGRVDEDGYFFLVDRLKRMINAAGFKIWPAEVESMLYGHPAIHEAAVIARKDPRRGEVAKAVVVLKPSARGEVTVEELAAWAKEHMAAYKVPASFEIADTLPKSATGKIMWRVLQEQEDARHGRE